MVNMTNLNAISIKNLVFINIKRNNLTKVLFAHQVTDHTYNNLIYISHSQGLVWT